MSKQMVTLSLAETREFLTSRGRIRVRDSHEMTRRVCHWSYCSHCGLVALRNERSRKALGAKCVTEEDT